MIACFPFKDEFSSALLLQSLYVKKYANLENIKGSQLNETLYCGSDPPGARTLDLLIKSQ